MDSDKRFFFDIDNPDHPSRDKMVQYMTDAGLCVAPGTAPCPLPGNICDADDGVYTVAKAGGEWFHLTKVDNGSSGVFYALNASKGDTAVLPNGSSLRGPSVRIIYKTAIPSHMKGKVVFSINGVEISISVINVRSTTADPTTTDNRFTKLNGYYSVLGYSDNSEALAIGSMVGTKLIEAKEYLTTGELFNHRSIKLTIVAPDTVEPFMIGRRGQMYQSPFGQRFG